MRIHKPTRDEAMLISMAETVGSTLGVLAAKASAVQKALTHGAAPSKPPDKDEMKKGRASRSKGTKVAVRGSAGSGGARGSKEKS